MASKPKYQQLSEKYANTLILQVRGNFYNAFSDSAKVLAAVFEYKLVQSSAGICKTGFPIDGSECKFEYLRSQNISFIAMNKDEIVEEYDASAENQYGRILGEFKIEPKPADKSEMSLEESNEKSEVTDTQKYVMLETIQSRFEQFCSERKDFSMETCFNLVVDEGLRKWGY